MATCTPHETRVGAAPFEEWNTVDPRPAQETANASVRQTESTPRRLDSHLRDSMPAGGAGGGVRGRAASSSDARASRSWILAMSNAFILLCCLQAMMNCYTSNVLHISNTGCLSVKKKGVCSSPPTPNQKKKNNQKQENLLGFGKRERRRNQKPKKEKKMSKRFFF